MIFISHSSQDRKAARALCAAMEARKLDCWIASRDVGAGQNFQDAIVDAIRNAKVMVLVFSQNANNSSEIKKELALASQQRLPVIPVRIEDVTPAGGFVYELATRQWIDLFEDWDHAVDAIVRQVAAIDGVTQPPLPARASSQRPRRRMIAAAAALIAIVAGGGVIWKTGVFRSNGIGAKVQNAENTDAISALPNAPAEAPATRVSAFSIQVRLGATPADRTWARVTPTNWVETDDHGGKAYLTTVRRITLGDCPGSVLIGDEEKTKHVFVPDKGCPGMPLKLSYEGGRSWGVAGWMTDVR